MKDDLVELLAQMRVSAKDACGLVEGTSREESFPARVPRRHIARVANVSNSVISARLQPNSISQTGMKVPML